MSVLDADVRSEVESLLETIEDEGWSIEDYDVHPGDLMRTPDGAKAIGKEVRLTVAKR